MTFLLEGTYDPRLKWKPLKYISQIMLNVIGQVLPSWLSMLWMITSSTPGQLAQMAVAHLARLKG